MLLNLFLKPGTAKHHVIGHVKPHNQVVIVKDLCVFAKKVSKHVIHMLWLDSPEVSLIFVNENFGLLFDTPFKVQEKHILVAAQS